MKSMKKSLTIGIAAFALCLMFCFFIKVDASAKCTTEVYSGGKSIGCSLTSYSGSYQVKLLSVKKKTVATDDCYTYTSFNTKPNRVYYVQYRKVSYDGVYSKWSKRIPVVTMNKVTLSLTSKKSKKVRVKLPKIKGVKNYTIYISTSKNKGFRKVKTVKKSVILSKYKGKSFKYSKTYYYKIVPKVGSKKSTSFIGNFYIYKRYY